MSYFEVDCVFGTKAYVCAPSSEAAEEMWSRLAGTQIDLLDPRWTESDLGLGIRLADRLLFWKSIDSSLRQTTKAAILSNFQPQPKGTVNNLWSPKCSLPYMPTYVLNVAIRSTIFISGSLWQARQIMALCLDGTSRRHATLTENSEYWFSLRGFESERFPVVVRRFGRIDDFLGYEDRSQRSKYEMADLEVDLRRSQYASLP